MLDKIEKLKKLTIIFVDDEIEIIEIISDTLKKLKVNFFVAYNGEEALRLINANKIDLLVTDINMPIMDGIKLIEILRDNHNQIDSIIMSAYTEKRYKDKSKDLNVKEYITKPFDFLEFLDVIDNLD
jgi:YesN/AraC family two-component response regulator